MHDDRADFGKATGLLLSLTEDGPVSGWVDRIGELVRREGRVPPCSIEWGGSPSTVAHAVGQEYARCSGLGRLLDFLRAEEQSRRARPDLAGVIQGLMGK